MSSQSSAAEPRPRFPFIDLLRGIAIVAMVIYHAGFIFSAEQLIRIDVINDPYWTIFARLTAGTFIALVGFNIVLATRNGLRPHRFFRRLAFVVGAAGLVTAGTYFYSPREYVFFGILHFIALASVLLLAFRRLPIVLVAALAAAAIALPFIFEHPIFDAGLLWWVGLSVIDPTTLDYFPLLPWFSVALAGLIAGRLFVARGTGSAAAGWAPDNVIGRGLIAAGRWSLPLYLIHPPVLAGIAMVAANVFPPNVGIAQERFSTQCVPSCQAQGSSQVVCDVFCSCLFEGLYDTDLYAMESVEAMSEDQSRRFSSVINQCRAEIPAKLES